MSKPPPAERPRRAFRLCCEGCGRAVVRVTVATPPSADEPPYRVSREQACTRLDEHEGRSWSGTCVCGRTLSLSQATAASAFLDADLWKRGRVPRLTIAQMG